jgi:uroporphyrin-III C-methyltransferase
MDAQLPPGTVWLVGAGPGDPELITLRGLDRLRRADVVLYDALIHPDLLRHARPDAELIHVGKRGYCVGSCKQDDIHRLLVDLARAGKSVCRLKGGDPCVFGRGGEEAEHLAAAGIAFEIVPGVTAALAACAAAAVPLTHRGAGRSVALVSGHFDPDSPECDLDWGALARVGTAVFYMGLRHLEKLADRLTGAGLAADTPAAVIASATLPGQRVIDGPLSDVARLAREAGLQAPAVFVVGPAVRYRARLLSSVGQVANLPFGEEADYKAAPQKQAHTDAEQGVSP